MYKYRLLLCAFLVSHSLIAFGEGIPAILVKGVEVKAVDFYDTFIAVGKCHDKASKDYYARADGIVDYVSPNQGKMVKAGEVLVSIDTKIAKTTISQAEAAMNIEEQLHKRGIDKSVVSLEAAKNKLAVAKKTHDQMVITAPFSGFIGALRVKVGDEVKNGDYLLSLVQNDDKIVVTELPEILNGKINDNSIVYTIDKDGKKVFGKISAISNYLSDNGTVSAKVIFPKDANLTHGSFIHLNWIFNQHKGLGIPEACISRNDTGSFIYKVDKQNTISRVYVKLGTRTSEMAELVSDNLVLGDIVVLEGLTKVEEGAKVEVSK